MASEPEALARAHIKPGTKFYHGGHGTSHFGPDDELHLPESHVQRLITDGLLHTGPVAVLAASAAEHDPAAEAEPAADEPQG